MPMRIGAALRQWFMRSRAIVAALVARDAAVADTAGRACAAILADARE
jgi:hypothetical protein